MSRHRLPLAFVSDRTFVYGFAGAAASALMAVVVALASLASLSAQASHATPARTHKSTAAPAAYLVEFDERSFDLEALGAAIRRRSAADVGAIVADLERRVRNDQASFVAAVEALGGKVRHQYWLVNACAVTLADARDVEALRRLPSVRRVVEDRYLRPDFIRTATNAQNHVVDVLHVAGVRGKGVSLAVLDSGLDISANGRLRPHRCFYVNGDPSNTSGGGIGGSRILAMRQVGSMVADDVIDHGTAVAAVAAGEVWGTAASDAGQAPLASIVGYSMSETTSGLTLISTMVKAFQAAVTDSVAFNIRAINMSYEGTSSSTSLEEQAIDVAARIGDLVVVVSGGNNAPFFAHASTNRIAVGAVVARTATQLGRAVADFSTRGPLPGGDEYPTLVANGVAMTLPVGDREGSDRVANGTSYAAPNVAGAALLFRSVDTRASALVTRAALLASAEDVAGKHRSVLNKGENHYGFGYLRSDQLVGIARGQGGAIKSSGVVTVAQASQTLNYPVFAGRDYAVAIAWDRFDPTDDERCDLDLELRASAANGRVLIGEGKHRRIVHELVRFRAERSEAIEIKVVGKTFVRGRTSIDFGLVVTEALPFFAHGTAEVLGTGCGFSVNEVPSFSQIVAPEIGQRYGATIVGSRAGAAFVLTLGTSLTKFGTFSLPLPLTAIGAPGCTLYASPDFVFVAGTMQASGTAPFQVTVPADNALLHAVFGHQVLTLAPQTNTLGLLTSHGLRVRVGGDPR